MTAKRLIVSFAILLVVFSIYSAVNIPGVSSSCLDDPAACGGVPSPSPPPGGGVPVPPPADPCLVNPAACGGVPVPPPAVPTPGGGGGGGGVPVPPVIPVPVPSPMPGLITPVITPAPAVPIEIPALPLTDLEIRLQAPLFMRLSTMPDADCLRPGESAILPVGLHNVGTTTLNDLRFMAAVPELDMVSASGPMKFVKDAKSTLFLPVDVPGNAAEGEYYLAFVASNGRFGNAVYRPFSVGRTC